MTIKKGIGGVLLLGEIKMNLVVTPKGAQFDFDCTPAQPMIGTELEDIFIAATKHLISNVQNWEKRSTQAVEIKMAGRAAAGFVEPPSDEE